MTIENQSGYPETRPMVFPQYKYYPAKVTIRHWQLRDLLCKPSNRASSSEVLYPSAYNIHAVDLESSKNTVVAEFDFEPRCLQATDSLVAAGGLNDQSSRVGSVSSNSSSNSSLSGGGSRGSGGSQRGLFGVVNRSTGDQVTGDLGDQINNAVMLYQQSENNTTAIVCNNDYHMYFLDVNSSGWRKVHDMKLPSPLNHATISPDHKTIIAVGDTSQVLMLNNQDRTGTNWKVSSSFGTGSDLGFSAAFHPSGMTFGVAFQDGMARLYDVRKTNKPLTEFKSSRPIELMGAFRSMRFSTGPEDLLFISEHMHRIHVIDLRDYSNHQILTVPVNFAQQATNMADIEPFQHMRERPRPGTTIPPGAVHNLNSNVHVHRRGDPLSQRFNRYYQQQSDTGIAGLLWSEHDGGSLVVGTESGLGAWKADGWMRRTFPLYKMR